MQGTTHVPVTYQFGTTQENLQQLSMMVIYENKTGRLPTSCTFLATPTRARNIFAVLSLWSIIPSYLVKSVKSSMFLTFLPHEFSSFPQNARRHETLEEALVGGQLIQEPICIHLSGGVSGAHLKMWLSEIHGDLMRRWKNQPRNIFLETDHSDM